MSEYVDIEDAVIQSALTAAGAFCVDNGITPVDQPSAIEAGSSFTIPLVIPKGKKTGDRRFVLADADLDLRDLPIPLLWQFQTGDGHDGSVLVGRIDSADIDESGVTNARGVFDTGPYAREAERLVRNGFLRGISADLDEFQVMDEGEFSASELEDGSLIYIKGARVMAATLLPKQAFQECTLVLDDTIVAEIEADVKEDDASEEDISALIASAIPVEPPEVWFSRPLLAGPTPLTIDDDGRVFGHIATWQQDHISFAHNVNPPRSRSNYAYFHTGIVRTDSGKDVTVGQLTLAGGHAPLEFSTENAVKHYDDTASAIADVHAGEDEFGIWVAGALRPGVTPEQIRVLRASAPSGDWRPIGNRLELVAVCQVNVPGFPVTRAMVASGGLSALVAAGVGSLYRMKHPEITEHDAEMAALVEQREMAIASIESVRAERRKAKADAARAAFAPLREERNAAKEELARRKAELTAQVAQFRIDSDFDPDLHPRDRSGQFRKVLFRLSNILGDDDTGASEALNRAADAQENGDSTSAVDAAREAKTSVHEALNRIEDPATKEALAEVEEQINSAIKGEQSEPESDSSAAETTPLEEALAELIALMVDELAESVDPKRQAEAAAAQVIQYVNDKGLKSPEEFIAFLAQILGKQFQPDIIQ